MKILIVNGIPNSDYQEYEDAITNEINRCKQHQVEYFILRELKIAYCTGCWDCWMKTPGLCAIHDDQEQIISRFPHVDRVLFISPILAGYESALLKKFKDRMIPLAHPYISVYKGEQHHQKRYDKLPDMHVLFIRGSDTDQEDVALLEHTYQRVVLNLRCELKGFHAINSAGGVQNVFSHFER